MNTHTCTDDPRPVEPEEPDLNDCCGDGCMPCVFDTWIEHKRAWEKDLQAWRDRHPEASGSR